MASLVPSVWNEHCALGLGLGLSGSEPVQPGRRGVAWQQSPRSAQARRSIHTQDHLRISTGVGSVLGRAAGHRNLLGLTRRAAGWELRTPGRGEPGELELEPEARRLGVRGGVRRTRSHGLGAGASWQTEPECDSPSLRGSLGTPPASPNPSPRHGQAPRHCGGGGSGWYAAAGVTGVGLGLGTAVP